MKKINITAAFLLLASMFVSCSSNDDIESADNNQIRTINPTIAGSSRVNTFGDNSNAFLDEDEIDVWAGSQDVVTFRKIDGIFTTLLSGKIVEWESSPMMIHAVYPSGASYEGFSVPLNQSVLTPDNKTEFDNDYITFSGEVTKTADGSVSFEMERQVALINISPVLNPQVYPADAGYRIKMITVRAENGIGNAPRAHAEFIPYYNEATKTYMCTVAPTTKSDAENFITVHIATPDNKTKVLRYRGIPAIEKNTKYNIKLNINKTLSIGGIEIDKWYDNPVEDHELEQETI